MILLARLSLAYARKHVLRTILTTVGIALGVGVLVGMHTANETVLAGFADTVDLEIARHHPSVSWRRCRG